MARSGRQTFKKRQREMNKKQKKQDKAKRLAARKGDGSIEEEGKEEGAKVIDDTKDGKPKLKIMVVGKSSSRPDGA
jgi:hypothetical protein